MKAIERAGLLLLRSSGTLLVDSLWEGFPVQRAAGLRIPCVLL